MFNLSSSCVRRVASRVSPAPRTVRRVHQSPSKGTRMSTLDRRSFLTRGAAAAGTAVVGSTLFQTLNSAAGAAPPSLGRSRVTGQKSSTGEGGYGTLSRVADQNGDEILALPDGFDYVTFSKIGDIMSDGTPVPVAHDGMAAFEGKRGTTLLIRNHEVRTGPGTVAGSAQAPTEAKYDPLGVGGTTTLVFDTRNGRLERHFVSFAGSIVTCAGGIAYEHVGWLTSEETVAGPNQGWGRKHGYNFLVRTSADRPEKSPILKAMGRFAHEAVATDPRTGIVYETEDSGNDSGFYRFRPRDPGDLAEGGTLEQAGHQGTTPAVGDHRPRGRAADAKGVAPHRRPRPRSRGRRPRGRSAGHRQGGGVFQPPRRHLVRRAVGRLLLQLDQRRRRRARPGVALPPPQGRPHPVLRVARRLGARLARQPVGHPPRRHPAVRGRRQRRRQRHPSARTGHRRRQPAHRHQPGRRGLRVRGQRPQRQRVRGGDVLARRRRAVRQPLRRRFARERDDLRDHRSLASGRVVGPTASLRPGRRAAAGGAAARWRARPQPVARGAPSALVRGSTRRRSGNVPASFTSRSPLPSPVVHLAFLRWTWQRATCALRDSKPTRRAFVQSIKKRRLAWLSIILAFSLTAAACGDDDDDAGADADTGSEPEGGGDVSGSINISGSSTVEPISSLAAEAFNGENPDVNIAVDGPGTGDGFTLFCDGEIDISDASRAIEEEEIAICEQNGIEYVELLVASDGLTVMTSANNDSDPECLSFADLWALIGSESEGFDNWSDATEIAAALGSTTEFPDAPLDLTGPGTESGTYDSFIE